MEPESYLDVALIEWLPRRWRNAGCDRALGALAERFEARHGDRWLRDVLTARKSELAMQGLSNLSAAAKANLADESDRALELAAASERDLLAAGDTAGALRADAEHAYALHRALRPAECLSFAKALERKATAFGYSWILGQALLEQGNCRSLLGDFGGAQRDFTRALAQITGAGYRDLRLRAESILEDSQVLAGNLLGAWDLGRQGLATYWSGPHPGNRAQQIYASLSRSAEGLGQAQSTYLFARAGAEALAGTPRHRLEALTRTRAAALAAAAGQTREAGSELEKAGTLFDMLEPAKSVSDYRAYAEMFRAEAELAAGGFDAALTRLGNIREQVRQSRAEVLRIRFQQDLGSALWHAGRMPEAESAFRSSIEPAENGLRTLRGSGERSAAILAAGKAYRGLIEIAWARGDAAAALRLWEWFRAGEAPGERRPPDLERRLPRLDKEQFLAYALLPGGMVVWLFDNRRLESHRLTVQPAELEPVVSRFTRECADPSSSPDTLRRDARQLYDWLIAPVADRLDPARTLVVEPDGPVGAIPLQALMDAGSRYLGERFHIAAASGLADYQRRSAAGPIQPGANALVVASPTLGKDMMRAFPPLPQATREGRLVAARFHSVPLTGELATLAELERRRPAAELFHFAGHGVSNASNGVLLLAPGEPGGSGAGVLDWKRLSRQDWSRCRLAVLSACSSGTGESRGPVNPESLVRRLLWAGVARVVATRWNVDAETSLVFMDEFYLALLSGADPAAALSRAGRTVRENSATSHPYYWAAFQLFGTR